MFFSFGKNYSYLLPVWNVLFLILLNQFPRDALLLTPSLRPGESTRRPLGIDSTKWEIRHFTLAIRNFACFQGFIAPRYFLRCHEKIFGCGGLMPWFSLCSLPFVDSLSGTFEDDLFSILFRFCSSLSRDYTSVWRFKEDFWELLRLLRR